jgi:hypothetical protein
MKKVILFIWFGDEKPPYIQWTLENFKRMNPGWEIRYIEYSNEQLLNYRDQDDPVLAATSPNKCFSFWVDDYKGRYLDMHKDEFVIYCDLDCFPIAPFDDFIMPNDDNLPKWATEIFCPNQHIWPNALGTCGNVIEGHYLFKEDLWCLCNNKALAFRQFLQICKHSTLDENLILYSGFLLNKSNLPIYKQRLNNFHNMNLALGDNFCLPQFTPIEHYYSFERDKLNISKN